MCLVTFAIVCTAGIQIDAQTVEQLREEVNRDNHLQALQQAWDGHNLARTRRLLKELEPLAGQPDRRSFPWYYYNYLANGVEVIRGVQRGFSGVFISPDNKTMLALGDRLVDVWELGARKKIATLATPYTDRASFSSDSRLVALSSRISGVPEKTLDVYDLKSHERVATFVGGEDATFSPDRKLLAILNAINVEFRSTTDWKLVRQLDGQGTTFEYVEFSKDGLYFAAVGRDYQVHVWRVSDGVRLFSLSLNLPDKVVFLENPCRLLVMERGIGARAWSVPDGTELSMFQGKPFDGGGSGAILISHDQKFLVTAVIYTTVAWIEVWDLAGGRLLRKLDLGNVYFDMCFLGKSNRIALSTSKGQLEVWNLETLKLERSLAVESEPLVTVGRVLDSDTEGNLYWTAGETVSILRAGADKISETKPVASASNAAPGPTQRSTMLWHTSQGLNVGDFATSAVRHIDILGALNGKEAAGGVVAGANIVNADTGSEQQRPVASSGDLIVAACNRNSLSSPTSNSDNESGTWSVHTLNARTGKPVSQFDFACGIQSIAISPDQKLLAIGSLEKEQARQRIYLCRTETGEVLAKLEGRVDHLQFSPDGKQLIGALRGDHPLVMPTTELSTQMSSKQSRAMAMTGPASRDKLLAFGMQSGEIEIWDYESGHHRQTLFGHPGVITSLEFTADAHYLVSSGTDNCAAMWSLATGSQVWTYASDKPIEQLQFDESGQNLGVRLADNSFHVLRGKP